MYNVYTTCIQTKELKNKNKNKKNYDENQNNTSPKATIENGNRCAI